MEQRFPLELEGLSERSIIVGSQHQKTLEIGAIPFYPFWGFDPIRINFERGSIPQEPIQTLKQLLQDKTTTGQGSLFNEDYEVFVFKRVPFYDTIYFKHLASNHGIILKNYSNSFCKMELVDESKSRSESKPDEICYLFPRDRTN